MKRWGSLRRNMNTVKENQKEIMGLKNKISKIKKKKLLEVIVDWIKKKTESVNWKTVQ